MFEIAVLLAVNKGHVKTRVPLTEDETKIMETVINFDWISLE